MVWHGYMELVSSERGFQVVGRTVYFANLKVGMREEALMWGSGSLKREQPEGVSENTMRLRGRVNAAMEILRDLQ